MKHIFKGVYNGIELTSENAFKKGRTYYVEIEAQHKTVHINSINCGHNTSHHNTSWVYALGGWEFEFNSLWDELLLERLRQDHKFGERDQHAMMWAVILGEEVGEVNKEICESGFEWTPNDNYRNELIEVAAVSLAAIQNWDYSKSVEAEAERQREEERRNDENEQITPDRAIELGFIQILPNEFERHGDILCIEDKVKVLYLGKSRGEIMHTMTQLKERMIERDEEIKRVLGADDK